MRSQAWQDELFGQFKVAMMIHASFCDDKGFHVFLQRSLFNYLARTPM